MEMVYFFLEDSAVAKISSSLGSIADVLCMYLSEFERLKDGKFDQRRRATYIPEQAEKLRMVLKCSASVTMIMLDEDYERPLLAQLRQMQIKLRTDPFGSLSMAAIWQEQIRQIVSDS